jgi:hypothetical protein
MVTLEERVSWLEGAFQQLMARMDTLPTRDEVRAEIRESEVRMIKWMVGMMVAQAALTVAAIGTAVALVRLTS